MSDWEDTRHAANWSDSITGDFCCERGPWVYVEFGISERCGRDAVADQRRSLVRHRNS